MLERVLAFSIRQRVLVVVACLGLALVGLLSFPRLRIDAVPDITNVQVAIDTITEGLTPEEVEQQVTYPIETGMAGIPGVVDTRSFSRYGLSQITVDFADGTDIYFARQRVSERLQEVRESLPAGAKPQLGPITTALGEIVKYIIDARPDARKPDGTPYTTTDLREIQDWIVRPQLRGLPGVTEIGSHGGFRRQFHVTPDPARLVESGISFQDLIDALEANNAAAGGGFVDAKSEQYLVNTTGRLRTEDDIRDVVVRTRRGVPVRVRDVASVGEGRELRGGAATERGEEVILGTAMMLVGENSRVVSRRVEARIEQIARTLPKGVQLRTVYSRGKLVDATIDTVRTNLFMGAALVMAVLLFLLGDVRGALIVSLTIPLSLMFAISGMVTWGISANLLSLGAVDFGIIVDGAVVMLENLVRRLSSLRERLGRALTLSERLSESLAASSEVARPTLFGVAIIMIVYLPILTLTGVEGKMFRPMAQVVLLALAGALLFAFTFVPAAASLVLGGGSAHGESGVMRWLQRRYTPALGGAVRRRGPVVIAAVALFALALLASTRLGTEFIPTLDEGDLLIIVSHIPGTSLAQTLEMERSVEAALVSVPEVANVFGQIGTGDVASDPMPPNVGDLYLIMKPRREWPHPGKSKQALVAELEARLADQPGNIFEFTQPIQDRFNELIAGVTSDVAVKIYGDDLGVLARTGREVAKVLAQVPGAADVKVEQVAGLPMLTVDIDRPAAARYGVSVRDIQSTVRTALAGTEAGQVLEGDRRFEIIVRLPEGLRSDLHALERLPVAVPAGESPDVAGSGFVPLGAVAHIALSSGPNEIARENGKRLIVVKANVRGRDMGGFVAEAQQRMDRAVRIPESYWIAWGGQFENLIAARQRLTVVVPLALVLILALLFGALGSFADALLVFSGVPLALTGGLFALLVRGMPLSITAGVGFIALSGVAVLNGLVMVSFIGRLRRDGVALDEAIERGCESRLRPVLMTALVASLGFVPMAIATGTGAEVQRPLATVVIGGILSSTLLTLVVLPALYRMVHGERRMK